MTYVVKRFPKLSETFVLAEIAELERQGERVDIFSLCAPHAREPLHPVAKLFAERVHYLPKGPVRHCTLLTAAAGALLTNRQAWRALGFCVVWAVRERKGVHLEHFTKACWIWRSLTGTTDHIHAHFAHDATTTALVLACLLRRPFSFTGHARDIFVLVRPRLLQAKAAQARFVIAVSEYTRAYIAEAVGPGLTGKVVVVRNGVTLNRSRQYPWQGKGPTSLVLSVARLVEKKGLDTLIAAAALLRDTGVPFRVEIVGEGPERSALEMLVKRHRLDTLVRLSGMTDAAGVAAALARAVVMVLPCRRTDSGDQDGLPVALVEAMATGVPVVSTRVSAIPEVVENEVSGLLVAPDDPTALASAVRRLLEDPELAARLSAGGRAAVEAFSLPACVWTLRRLFREGPPAGGLPAASRYPCRQVPALPAFNLRGCGVRPPYQ